MEVSQKFAEYDLEVGVPDGDQLFSLYDEPDDAEVPAEDIEPMGDDEISSLSEVFEPIPIPSEISPDRKYDDGGGKSPQALTNRFEFLHGKQEHIRKKPSNKPGTEHGPKRSDYDPYGKFMLAERKKKILDLHTKDRIEEIGDNSGVRSVSEQLWQNEDMRDNELNWKKFLQEFGKTSEEKKEKEYVISILTDEDKKLARAYWVHPEH
ncbi:hypothetical protein K0B04_01140 [Patescibacteria group bacterium]|nr:hypothetical protein [Patescibacteria group bacterium]